MQKSFYATPFLLFVGFFLGLPELHAQDDDRNSLLYQVSGNGLDAPSYLYGTMHVADKRAFKFNPEVMPAFEKSKGFAMEMDPNAANPMAILQWMKLDSITLEDLFTEEEFDRLETYFKEELGQSLSPYLGFKPFFLYTLLLGDDFGSEMGEAVDLYFYKNAKEQGKTVYGLETMDEQLGAIDQISLEEQAGYLMEAIDNPGGAKKETKRMMKYYKKGELNKLYEMSEDMDMGSNFESALLVDRNYRMVERLTPLIKKESTFIAVGALHLPGEEGILTLLEKEGYTITALK